MRPPTLYSYLSKAIHSSQYEPCQQWPGRYDGHYDDTGQSADHVVHQAPELCRQTQVHGHEITAEPVQDPSSRRRVIERHRGCQHAAQETRVMRDTRSKAHNGTDTYPDRGQQYCGNTWKISMRNIWFSIMLWKTTILLQSRIVSRVMHKQIIIIYICGVYSISYINYNISYVPCWWYYHHKPYTIIGWCLPWTEPNIA